MRLIAILCVASLALSGCGVVYHSPSVKELAPDGTKVRLVPITAETVLLANRSPYRPKTLPAIFSQTAGYGNGLRGAGAPPPEVYDLRTRPGNLQTRVPPDVNSGPYRLGVGDVVLLATPRTGSSVEQLTGLLAATTARQGYTVQDDGTIAIPSVGRVQLVGKTLEEAEDALFQRLVENQMDPTFSLEIAEFNSKQVTVGGAVGSASVLPITLQPLTLDLALNQAGGVTAPAMEYASIRIYRDGTLYQIPLTDYYQNSDLRNTQLIAGDSVFVDTAYELDLAQAYFQQQIALAQFTQSARSAALSQLNAEIGIRRGELNEKRSNYQAQVDVGAIDRDYVYLIGEVGTQTRYVLPMGNTASLADALYEAGGGLNLTTADVRHLYVLRASDDPRDFGAVTAWSLNAKNAVNFTLAPRFELRPDDIIFIGEQPVTRWNRTINQIVPSLSIIRQGANLAAN